MSLTETLILLLCRIDTGLADGLKVDTNGNLYSGNNDGVMLVF